MRTTLRHNEYYNIQDTFDKLYDDSINNNMYGKDLYNIIISKANILLAYRNIKANTGSCTAGTDGMTIKDYKNISVETLIPYIRQRLENYKPQSVKRVYIPKSNGKLRPLGIPTMEDRLIQQMFKQVLEPIVEAKFHKHSYGFRPNRATKNAIARTQHLINKAMLTYVIDFDIKSFFDEVNHNKLMRQLYSIGIKDQRVLNIIHAMLKAPIKGIGIPNMGTPQGGILSPLLANVVLNEIDWWVDSQWENKTTKHKHSNDSNRYKVLKETGLKKMFIVRYADDFKIFTTDYKTAKKILHAVRSHLKETLKLRLSKSKTKITNLKKRKSEFLGFTIKAKKKKDKHIAYTHMSDKAMEKVKETTKVRIKEIQQSPTPDTVMKYNNYIISIKNYYKIATHINIDLNKIAYQISTTLFNRLKSIGRYGKPREPNETYKKFNKNNFKTYKVGELYLHPLADVQTQNNMNFSQVKCNYTIEGRKLLHKKLKDKIIDEIIKLNKYIYGFNTVELADNKLSRYSMQNGSCSITKQFMNADEVNFHHILPKKFGGDDKFNNLTTVHKDIHKLIHATQSETIENYFHRFNLDEKQIKKVNKLRKSCKLEPIIFS